MYFYGLRFSGRWLRIIGFHRLGICPRSMGFCGGVVERGLFLSSVESFWFVFVATMEGAAWRCGWFSGRNTRYGQPPKCGRFSGTR